MKKALAISMLLLTCLTFSTLSLTAQSRGGGRDDRDRDRDRNNPPRPPQNNNIRPLSMLAFNYDFYTFVDCPRRDRERIINDYTRDHVLTSDQIRALAMLLPNDRDKQEYFYRIMRQRLVYDPDRFATVANTFATRDAREDFFRYLHRENLPCNDGYGDDYYEDRRGNGGYGGYGNPNSGGYGNGGNNGGNGNGYNNGNNPPPRPALGMNNTDFDLAVRQIKAQSFDNTRLDLARNICRDNPMTAAQVTIIARIFTFDNSRLEFAKIAYTNCVEPRNFFQVAEAFQYDSNKRDLLQYIEKNRRP
jgi:hypothetical protein